jgi:hypothetical protein
MIIHVLMTQPMTARDQTITLSSGPLTCETELVIPADAEPSEQEYLAVCKVFSKTQAQVVRGARGTIARSYPANTIVGVSSDGMMHEPARSEPETEALPETIRPSRRQPLDIAATTQRGACPLCGCTGQH